VTPEELLGEARDLLREYVLVREGWTKTSAGRWRNDLGHTLDLGPAYEEARRRGCTVDGALHARLAVNHAENQLAVLGGYGATPTTAGLRFRAPTLDGELYTLAGAADRVVADAKRRAADAPPAEPVVDRGADFNQAPAGGA